MPVHEAAGGRALPLARRGRGWRYAGFELGTVVDVDRRHRLACTRTPMAAVVETRDDEIGRLQRLIKQLQRARFGRRSERLDPDQPALGLEDLGADVARTEAHQVVSSTDTRRTSWGEPPGESRLNKLDVVADGV